MFGRGRIDHMALQASSLENFEELRRRLMERGAADDFVTDFGPILSVFWTDPDGLECELTVINPDAEPGVFHPPGTRAARYPAASRRLMRIGFAAPTCGSWATPEIITEVAGRADELGYASLWTFQRLLYPEGTELSETYHSVLDPLIALGFLASCTTARQARRRGRQLPVRLAAPAGETGCGH